MAVRNFAGANDELRFPVPASGGANPTGAITVAALYKPATGSLTNYRAILAGHNSGGTYQWEFGTGGGNWLAFYSVAQGVESDSAFTLTAGSSWFLVAYTKPAGSSAGRFHILPLGGAWTHSAGNTSIGGNPATIASGHVSVGEAQDVDDLSGRVAVVGVWTSELTDAQVEALATNLRTADWTGHAVAPAGAWDLNQATATDDAPDLTANGQTATGTISGTTDHSGIQGTTIVTGDDPPGWTFGTGSSTTQVSSTRRVSYAVRAQVTATRRVNYGVRANVAATRALVYAVTAAVIATRRVSYSVTANVTGSRRVVYDVAASTTQIAATRGIVYSVSAQVAATRRVRYDVLASVLAERRVVYDVSKAVTATRRVSYAVSANVTAPRHVVYTVGDVTPGSGASMLPLLYVG